MPPHSKYQTGFRHHGPGVIVFMQSTVHCISKFVNKKALHWFHCCRGLRRLFDTKSKLIKQNCSQTRYFNKTLISLGSVQSVNRAKCGLIICHNCKLGIELGNNKITTESLTSFWSGKTFVQVKYNLFNEIRDIFAIKTANKHGPIVSKTLLCRLLPTRSLVANFQLNLHPHNKSVVLITATMDALWTRADNVNGLHLYASSS